MVNVRILPPLPTLLLGEGKGKIFLFWRGWGRGHTIRKKNRVAKCDKDREKKRRVKGKRDKG
jgi:hypothetical protein